LANDVDSLLGAQAQHGLAKMILMIREAIEQNPKAAEALKRYDNELNQHRKDLSALQKKIEKVAVDTRKSLGYPR
jgi:uncharacterized protein (DUF342 family)